MSDINQVAQQSQAAIDLLKNNSFRTSIDLASVEVVEICERLLMEHHDLVAPLMGDDESIGMVFAVLLGWILGFDLRDSDVKDGLSDRLLERVYAVMTAAGFSMRNVEAFKRKQIN